MTVLLLMVPPALCSVSPKMAKKMIGAMTDLKAKKYWTLTRLVGPASLLRRPRPDGGCENIAYLGVGDAQEGNLKQEIEQKADHSSSGDTLVLRDVIGDSGKAGPDGREQDRHTLTTSRGLDTGNREHIQSASCTWDHQ